MDPGTIVVYLNSKYFIWLIHFSVNKEYYKFIYLGKCLEITLLNIFHLSWNQFSFPNPTSPATSNKRYLYMDGGWGKQKVLRHFHFHVYLYL